MLSWIDKLAPGQRFFLTCLPIAGHHPYDTPERGPFPEREEIGRYRNALLYGDASLGALIEGLRARGLENRTLFVIYGDHGEAFGQHEGNYAHTFFVYEENVHVPFVIAAPGRIRGQTRVKNVVAIVDTAAYSSGPAWASRSGTLSGSINAPPGPRMALFFADYSLGILGLRDGPWKFIYRLDSRMRPEIFNLNVDSAERHDLSPSNRDRAALVRTSGPRVERRAKGVRGHLKSGLSGNALSLDSSKFPRTLSQCASGKMGELENCRHRIVAVIWSWRYPVIRSVILCPDAEMACPP